MGGIRLLRPKPSVPRSVTGALPPHDIPAQRCVLGVCLLDPGVIDTVSSICEANDFWGEPYQVLAECLYRLHGAGIPIDPVVIRNDLEACGRWSLIGSPLLAEVANAPSTTRTVEHHARVVRNHAINRRLIVALQQAEADLYHESASTTAAWRDGLLQGLGEILAEGGGARMISAQEAAKVAAAEIVAKPDGEMIGIPTGVQSLDEETGGLIAPQIYLVGAETGGGKTAFQHSVALSLARRGIGVAIFSPELTAKENLQRLACNTGRIDWKRLANGSARQSELTAYLGALEDVGRLPIEIDEDRAPTTSRIRSKLRTLSANYARRGLKLGVAILDGISLVKRDDPGDKNEEQQLSDTGRECSEIAQTFGIPMLVATQLIDGRPAHCRRLLTHAENFWRIEIKPRKKPTIPGAGEYPHDAHIQIVKGRFTGRGSASTYFHHRYARFSDEAV